MDESLGGRAAARSAMISRKTRQRQAFNGNYKLSFSLGGYWVGPRIGFPKYVAWLLSTPIPEVQH